MLSRLQRLFTDALADKEFDYTTLPIPRAILLLAIPMMLEMAMESVFALVDTYFVGRLGTEALTTIGLTEVMMTLVYSVAVGLSIAPMSIVARKIGEKRPEEAGQAAIQSILLTVVVSLIIAVPGVYFAEDLLRLMGASDAVVTTGKNYTRIMFGSNTVIMLLFVINGIFRGAGEAAKAMRVLILANGINILLDPLFIFGWGPIPGYGVEGAAIATTIGRGLGVAYQFYPLFRTTSTLQIDEHAWRVDWGIQRRIADIASTGAFQYLIGSASWVFLMRIVAQFGDEAVAGYTVAIRLILFTLLPAWGLANAAAAFVGQNLGARQPGRAERGVWLTLRIISVYLGVLAFGYYFFAGPLVQGFVAEPFAVAAAVQALQLFAVGYIFFGIGLVPVQAFNGAGDTRTPTLINFVCFWIIEIPLSYWLAVRLGWGVQGVVGSVIIAEVILATAALYLFIRGSWKTVDL